VLRHRRFRLLLTPMDLVQIYQCFCDRTRLRLLHLLTQSPLCVCHFQEILAEPQVKISKHLAYLRERGLVEVEREGNWMIYSLPAKRPAELEKNLKCLQDCAQSDQVFGRDLKNLARLRKSCCEPAAVFENSLN
jgi:ArsR family transcriptional regulator